MARRGIRMADLPAALRAQLEPAGSQQPKRHKYGVSAAITRTFEGIVFASKWELRVYRWLKQWMAPGVIITLQPRMLLAAGTDTEKATWIVPDFLIGQADKEFLSPDALKPQTVVIDAKGMETALFKDKHKRFRILYNRRLFLPKTEADLWRFPWKDFGITTKL